MSKLISFITPSRRLENIKGFFDNIEQTVSDPSCVEVLIKFDDDQPDVVEFIESEKSKRNFTIKYVITPRLEGIFSVWVGMEQLFFQTDPSSYFVMIMSDEPRFLTQHWDKILRNYIGFYKDDVFRLRLSTMRHTNYASHYECTFRPDSFPIYTRRWLELTEGSGNCWGSDAYQQCVAYQLSLGPGSYYNYYRADGLCRDLPLENIKLSGLEFGVGVSPAESRIRHKRNLKEWTRLAAFPMQEHFSYLARRINCYVWAYENDIKEFSLVKHPLRKVVTVVASDGQELMEVTYAVPRLVVYLQNFVRTLRTEPKHRIMILLDNIKYSSNVAIASLQRLYEYALKFIGFLITPARGMELVPQKAKLSTKRRIKRSLLKMYSYLYAPINFFLNHYDRWIETAPPGISVLYSAKPQIPKGINPPNPAQIDWLKLELMHQEKMRQGLSKMMFKVVNEQENPAD